MTFTMARITHEQYLHILRTPGYAPVVAGLPHPQPERHAAKAPPGDHQAVGGGQGRLVVLITRWAPNRLDTDNLYGGVKPLVDALRYAGYIPNDDPDSLLLVVRQRKACRKEQGTEILITTAAPAPALDAQRVSASASCSGAFLRDAFGIYFTPQHVLDAINPPKPPDIMDCICNPPKR